MIFCFPRIKPTPTFINYSRVLQTLTKSLLYNNNNRLWKILLCFDKHKSTHMLFNLFLDFVRRKCFNHRCCLSKLFDVIFDVLIKIIR